MRYKYFENQNHKTVQLFFFFFVFFWTDLCSEETYPNDQQTLTCVKKDSLFQIVFTPK